ncbi:MAG TPA: hypothetical protein VD997_10705 [Phycisphaerales bacterium]|nr:hypothetical protein [Phycisphaerales bacterium]
MWEWVQPTIDAAGRVPWMAYLPAVASVIGGLLLLLAGNRVLKPVTVVFGAAAGGLVGVVALTGLLEGHTHDCPAALAAMGVGSVVGALVAVGLFRATLAIAGAGTFAAIGVLIAGAVLSVDTTGAKVEFAVREQVTLISHAMDPEPSVESPEAVEETARVEVRQASDHVGNVWACVPEKSRGVLVLVGLGAGVLGFVVGALAPKKTEALVTSLLGAAVFLVSFAWVVGALGVGGVEMGAVGWLVVWGCVSAVGLGVQGWTGRAKAA